MKPLTKKICKEYLETKLEQLEITKIHCCFYVLGIDARELIGVIHFLWMTEILNDNERKKYNDKAYFYKSIAEKETNKSF